MKVHRQGAILAGFIAFSLLLHILLLNLLPGRIILPEPQEKKPVFVEVRPPQTQERELDLPQKTIPEKPRETPAKRLGPEDQVVPEETAPKGDSPEDRLPKAPPVPTPLPDRTVPVKPLPSESRPKEDVPAKPLTEKGESPAKPMDPAKLLNPALPQATVDRYQQEWRSKSRPDVAEGEAIWLDTEIDILNSFFKRFRDNIYNVWNYPPRSAERGEKGVCLLKITINRDGSVASVEAVDKSGFATLDREAIAAVYRGAPYGALPASYSGDDLQIMAYFEYKLSYRNVGERGIFGAR